MIYLKQYFKIKGHLLWLPLFAVALLRGQESTTKPVNDSESNDIEYAATNGVEDRFPLILSDAKSFFSEAIIADHHGDSLEVLYLLDKIVELLTEAEQLGEMSEDDREEFNRFEETMIHTYQNNFITVDRTNAPIATASLKEELSRYLEPIEIEINGSSFKVIDDREGHMPLVMNSRVERAIKFFETDGRQAFERWLSRFPYYGPLIQKVMTEHELPEELVFHAMVESGLNPRAYSRAHAVGMWQFISSTAKLYGLERTWWVDERRDPIRATVAAAKYLKDLYLEFDDWYLALAAYNAGAGRVNRAIRLHQSSDFWSLSSLPRETKNHVPTVLATAVITRSPEQYGFEIPEEDPFEFEEVTVEKSADLAVLAKCVGIKVEELRRFNPELRQHATPPEEPYNLKIPLGKEEMFLAAFSALKDEQRFAPQYMVHVVQRGHILSWIAKKYGVSMHQIASFNKIKNFHRLRIGQKLTIPIPGVPSTPILASESAPNTLTYMVRKGDTLGHIAMRYSSTARRIRQLNGLSYGSYIFPGQKLKVPVREGTNVATTSSKYVKEIYTVKTGDTLSHIAERYRVGMSKLRQWNSIRDSDFIIRGQRLVIYVRQG
ncbi:MAG: LysM peptidoglycan-binding domain-containing protein [Candidatus Neomarinimicrobiota bacterium]|nr:LysM peptidoglycan-binding domain-containing protein [Candidatus Neomarinimicrobiota bacterium]